MPLQHGRNCTLLNQELNVICAHFPFIHVQSHLGTHPAATAVVVRSWLWNDNKFPCIWLLHGWPDGPIPFSVTFHKAGNQSGLSDMADTDATSTQISLSPLLKLLRCYSATLGRQQGLRYRDIYSLSLFSIIISIVGAQRAVGYDFDTNTLNPCCAFAMCISII